MISVICPIFNKELYLAETIESVIQQSSDLWELILVDDGSADNSINIAKQYADNYSSISLYERKTVNSELKGANACRNIGANHAKGDWLVFLDADDIMLPNCIENRLQQIRLTDEYFNMMIFKVAYAKGHPAQVYDNKATSNDIVLALNKGAQAIKDIYLRKFLKFDLPWHTTGVVWKKSFFFEIGGFNRNYQRLQDPEIHTRALLEDSVVVICKTHLFSADVLHRMDEDRRVWDSQTFFNRQLLSIIQFVNDFYLLTQEKGQHKKIHLLQGYLLLAEALVYNAQRFDGLSIGDSKKILEDFYRKIPEKVISKKFLTFKFILRITLRNKYLMKKRLPGGIIFLYKKILK